MNNPGQVLPLGIFQGTTSPVYRDVLRSNDLNKWKVVVKVLLATVLANIVVSIVAIISLSAMITHVSQQCQADKSE